MGLLSAGVGVGIGCGSFELVYFIFQVTVVIPRCNISESRDGLANVLASVRDASSLWLLYFRHLKGILDYNL